MLKAKNKNVVDIIFNNKHAVKVYKGVQLVWQKIAEFLHLTQVCGNSVQEGTPSPSNPIEIKSVGDKTKNLFNLNGEQKQIPWSTTIYYGIEIPVNANGGTYYASADVSSLVTSSIYYYLMKYTSTGSASQVITYFITKNATKKGTFTLNAGDRLFLYQALSNGSKLNVEYMKALNIMICESNSAQPFEPYGYKLSVDVNGTISTCYMNEPLRRIGQEYDEIFKDDEGYHIERRVGRCDLLPTMDWRKQNISTFNCIGMYVYELGTQIGVANLGITYPDVLYCNRGVNDLAGTSTGAKTTNAMMFNSAHTNLLWNVDVDDVGYSVSDFTTWLNDNPTYILYVMVESTIEDIEWDVEPLMPPDTDVVFLSEVQPSDYIIE